MRMSKDCNNCKFWQILLEEGQCRRHAPRLIMAGCGVGEIPEYSNDWPTTGKDDWCGEFKPQENRNERK